MLGNLKRLWKDPVLGAVLAAAIVAALYYLVGTWFWYALPAVLLVAALWHLVRRWAERWRLQAEVDICSPPLDHAVELSVSVRNPGYKTVVVTAFELVTREHWDMPDLCYHATNAPVATVVPAGWPLIKISPEKGSVASGPVGKAVKPRGSLMFSFVLITDHAPGFGIGLFPFHLGAALVLGTGERLPLPDIVVSLHGMTVRSWTDFGEPIYAFASSVRPGDYQSYANAVLSRVAQGAVCGPETLKILKAVAKGRSSE